MKILLIEPPFQRLKKIREVFFPIGLGYLASNLSKHGFEVMIYNVEIAQSQGETGIQTPIQYESMLKQHIYYREALADENHMAWREIREVINQYRPSLVGMTVRSAKLPAALKTARVIKAVDPECRVILGGPHPTICPLETISNEEVDFVLRGESEGSLVNFCQSLDRGGTWEEIPGLLAKRNGRIWWGPYKNDLIRDLDSLPFPGRELVMTPHSYPSHAMGELVTGRGCPYTCGYCSAHCIWGRKVRFRSVENVVSEIKQVCEKYNPRHFIFWDDSFTLNRRRIIHLCQSLIEQRLGIRWTCTTRPDLLDDELLEIMKESGCKRIDLGIESGSERMLKLINKGINLQQAENAVRLVKKHKIAAGAFFMIGFPMETIDDIEKTMAFMNKLNASRYVFSIFTPYPGTDLYEKANALGLIPSAMSWEQFDHQSPENTFSANIEIGELKRLASRMAAWIDRYHNRKIKRFIELVVVNSRFYFKHPVRILKKLRSLVK